MKNTFYLIAFIACMIASCKKETVSNTPPAQAGVHLEKYINGDEFIEFFYNEDTEVNKVVLKNERSTAGDETSFTVAYNNDKTIKELVANNGQRIVPVYDNGILTRADIFEAGVRVAYTAYNYENNNLKKATVYYQDLNDFLPVFELILTYDSNGNIAETVVMIADETPNHLVRAGSVQMEYDAHQNPLYAYNDLLALFWQAASKNNIAVENHFDAVSAPEDKRTYRYAYHENGMPATALVTKGLPGTEQTTINVNFIYK